RRSGGRRATRRSCAAAGFPSASRSDAARSARAAARSRSRRWTGPRGYNAREKRAASSRDGGTGRRSGLKIRRWQHHVGSIPSPGTTPHGTMIAPLVRQMRVVPVAGRDSMLLNLSGAHAPFFTRNLVVLTDTSGKTGVGEVPGGEKIRQTLEESRTLVEGRPIWDLHTTLDEMHTRFADRDSGGRGLQTFDLRTTIHAVTAVESS